MIRTSGLLLLASTLAIATSAAANAPDRLGKNAARKLASNMVNTCNQTDDALACLQDLGSECSPADESDKPDYRCTYELSVSATKVRNSDSPATEWDFEVTFLVKNGKKGWRAKTRSIREVKD